MLITLAIIGVVAALTIPTVVRNYQKQETVTKLKKVYSALSQTTNLAIADHGPTDTWEYDSATTNGASFSRKYIMPYLKVSKDCSGDLTYAPCNYEYSYRNGSDKMNFRWTNNAKFYLNDGTYMHIGFNYGTGQWVFAYIFVDLNGDKKPNIIGKDIFRFEDEIIRDWKPLGKFSRQVFI